MAKRNHRSRHKNKSESRQPPSPPPQVPTPTDKETVDGILVQIGKTDLTIAGEPPSRIQKRPGYEIKVAIPDWDKNRGLLDSIRKGHLAQQKLLTKLRAEGASRPWMSQRFNEVDKVVAAVLTTVAERIRSRRRRAQQRGEAFPRLRDTFGDLNLWGSKAARYCERAQHCADSGDKETAFDAACLAVLKVGELVNKVELMQHGFWEDYSAASFLDIRLMRNLVAHTDNLSGQDIIPLGTGIIRELHAAIRRTVFPDNAGPGKGGFMLSAKDLRELETTRPGEKPTTDNSIAMIGIDEKNRFIIRRVGRSEDNKMLFSSSVTGKTKLTVYFLKYDPPMERGSSG